MTQSPLQQNLPLITVITVVYNGEQYIEKTIKSIISQDYPQVEYIIIDGGSTDNTVKIIETYSDKISRWISETDKGIYDAMNKGIDLASGEWINFMNAGDTFYKEDTLTRLFNNNDSFGNTDIIYGDVMVDYGDFRRIEKAKKTDKLWKGMICSHQSAFLKTPFHKKNKYTLDFKIAGDFELFYHAFKQQITFKYVNMIIAIVDVEGLSDGNRFSTIKQQHSIINKYDFSIKKNTYYCFLYIDQLARKISKKFLPKKIINIIIEKGI